MKDINPIQLETFIRKAIENCYLGEMKKAEITERPGFFEMEYEEGNWKYRDSFAGFYSSAGQEIVRYKEVPVWSQSYCGGVAEKYVEDEKFANKVFEFLIKSLAKAPTDKYAPRGPKEFADRDWKYRCDWEGDVTKFSGLEKIYYKGEEVFYHRFIGGVIVGK